MFTIQKQLVNNFITSNFFRSLVVFDFKQPICTALRCFFVFFFISLCPAKASENHIVVIEGTIMEHFSGFYVAEKSAPSVQVVLSSEVVIVNQEFLHDVSRISEPQQRKQSKPSEQPAITQRQEPHHQVNLVYRQHQSDNVFNSFELSVVSTPTPTFKYKKHFLVIQAYDLSCAAVYSTPQKEFITKAAPQFSPKEKFNRYFCLPPPQYVV